MGAAACQFTNWQVRISMTYVADEDDRTALATTGGVVGKCVRSSTSTTNATVVAALATSISTLLETTTASAESSSSKSATATETTATAKSSATSAEAALEATTHAIATWTAGLSETVLTDFKVATVPFVAVVHLDGIASVFIVIEDYDTRSLRTTIRSEVNIGTNNVTSCGCICVSD